MPTKNAPALAAALERLLSDPALRTRLGIQARAPSMLCDLRSAYVDRLVGVWRGSLHEMALARGRAGISA